MPRFPTAQGRLNHDPGSHLSCDENLSEGWGPPLLSVTVVSKSWVAVSPSVSAAVTVMVAIPFATAVTVSCWPEISAVATPVVELLIEKSRASLSGSRK